MYAVIFKARVKDLDESYAATAKRMRDLAMSEYGCTEFSSSMEGDYEVAISYWPTKESIRAWRNNSEHQKAQAAGKEKWYSSYTVEVVEVLKRYRHEST